MVLLFRVSIYLKSHVFRKYLDLEGKTLKSEKDYRDNPTSFERFYTEIQIFYKTSAYFLPIEAMRIEIDTYHVV